MCLSYTTALVLSITLSSFQFGYGIGNINAITKYVISRQAWCDDPGIIVCRTQHLQLFCDLSIFVGAAVGCLISGSLTRYGRRYIFLRLQVLIIIGCAIQALTTDYFAFILGRLTFGFGIGIVCNICPGYIDDVKPLQYGTMYSAMHQIMVAVGVVVGIAAGVCLPPLTEGEVLPYPPHAMLGYKLVLGFPAILASFTMLLFILKFKEETPQFLIAANRMEEAGEFLRKLHGAEDVANELENLMREDITPRTCSSEYMSVEKAWESPMARKAIVIGLFLSVLQPLTGVNAFFAKSVDLLEPVNVQNARCISIIMAILNFLTSFPALYILENYGRRSILIGSSAAQFLSIAPAALVGYFGSESEKIWLLPSLCIMAMIGCTVASAVEGRVLWIYLNEMYPSVYKDSVLMLSAFNNWVATLFIVGFASLWAVEALFALCAAAAFFTFVIVTFFAVETKGLLRSPYSCDFHHWYSADMRSS